MSKLFVGIVFFVFYCILFLNYLIKNIYWRTKPAAVLTVLDCRIERNVWFGSVTLVTVAYTDSSGQHRQQELRINGRERIGENLAVRYKRHRPEDMMAELQLAYGTRILGFCIFAFVLYGILFRLVL